MADVTHRHAARGMTAPDERAVQRLARALRGAGVAEVDTSTRRRAEYSTDASLYRVVPAVVAFPRSVDDVVAALTVSRDHGVPVTCRGAGTSIAGNAVGTGVVLDFSRHLDDPPILDLDAGTAIVMPGVVLDDLQRLAAPHGLRFGPDPSTHDRCTLAGMIGNNACGSRSLAYGRTADNVLELEVLTGAGEHLRVGAGADPTSSPSLQALDALVTSHLDVIRAECGRFQRQVSGYALEHLLPERGFDVAKALVGTEGTCAIVLSATVRLGPAPAASILVVLGYPDLASAADAVPALLRHGPTAIEGLDARIVEVVRTRRGPASAPPLPRGNGWLFVELSGPDLADLVTAAAGVVADAGALDTLLVDDPQVAARLWRIREDGAGLTSRTSDGRAAHAGWEDAAVPPQRLGAYLREFDALLDEHGLTSMPYGHFGDGCLHVRIDFPLEHHDGARRMRRFVVDAAHLVSRHGGSLSGEHGDGRARSELLPIMYPDALIRAFAAFKHVFDPDDVLNPGVLVRPRPLDADLRSVAVSGRQAGPAAFALTEDGGDFGAAVHRCVGIGRCRADTTAAGGVMCPSFLATRDERESTRGRARVLQEMVDGRLVRGGWAAPEVHDALDLCLACKGCRSDCPAGVDMATYKAEVLHQTYRRRLRPASHYTMGWLPAWARLAALAPAVVNRVLALPPVAVVAKRAGGIDPGRELPRFAHRSFTRTLSSRVGGSALSVAGAADPAPVAGSTVLLWVDTFTEHFSPEVGVAAVRVLENAGLAVTLPSRRLCCGLTWISTGQLAVARRHLRRLVDALAPVVRAGLPVVGLEPSCTAVLRSDAVALLGADDAAARDVAAGVSTFAELLASRRPSWTPPSLQGVEVVAQPHCHQHAVLGWEPDRALVAAAGATVTAVGGCCGLAGNFGFERGHLDVSAAVAETALLPALRAAPHAQVLADGFSCRTQVGQLAGRRARHLAQLLADGL